MVSLDPFWRSARLVGPLLLAVVAIASQLGAQAPAEISPKARVAARLESTALREPGPSPYTTPKARPAASIDKGNPLQPRSFRIAVISDLNSAYGSLTYQPSVHAATRALVDRIQPDLVLITGDMVAGQKPHLDYAGMWRSFHTVVTEPLQSAGIIVAPTPGNHDASPARIFAEERSEYQAQWTAEARLPRVTFLDGSHYPFYYSFEYGGVFFASIDAARVGPLSEQQRSWLDRELSRTTATIKIVFGHLPVYPFAVQRERETLNDRALADLLRRHAVSAYLSGHHHAYYPGAVDGIRHVAMPCLGSGSRRLIGGSGASPTAFVVIDIEDGQLESLEALRAPEFQRPVARASLPPRIEYGQHRILRDDIAGLVFEPDPELVTLHEEGTHGPALVPKSLPRDATAEAEHRDRSNVPPRRSPHRPGNFANSSAQ